MATVQINIGEVTVEPRKNISVAEAASLLHKNQQVLRREIRQGNVPGGFVIGKHCFINWLTFSRATGYTENDL